MSAFASGQSIVVAVISTVDEISAMEISEVNAEVSRLNAMCHAPIVEEYKGVYTEDDAKLADITPLVHVSRGEDGVFSFRNRKELHDHIRELIEVGERAWGKDDTFRSRISNG